MAYLRSVGADVSINAVILLLPTGTLDLVFSILSGVDAMTMRPHVMSLCLSRWIRDFRIKNGVHHNDVVYTLRHVFNLVG